MTIKAEVITHSLHPTRTSFLATLRLTFPKSQLTHVLVHKSLAKNSASARAIPTRTFRRDVLVNPALPEFWGRAGKGMSAAGPLTPLRARAARFGWALHRYGSCGLHWLGERLGMSKETLNRLLEPHAHVVVLVSGTDNAWSNFLALRNHPAADPTTQALARAVQDALDGSLPNRLEIGDWHLPFAPPTGSLKTRLTSSVARCARTSYSTPDRPDRSSTFDEDLTLYTRLIGTNPVHASPAEHQAVAVPLASSGNLHFCAGWQCYRSILPDGGLSPNRFRDDDGFIKGAE